MASLMELLLTQEEIEHGPDTKATGPAYFHGGVRGLEVGDFVLPPMMTTATPLPRGRDDRVYFSNVDRARFQALACYGHHPPQDRGWVYEVKPCGPVKHDPAEGESWCARKALIVRVVERSVSHWRGMSFEGIITWACKNGDFAERPSMADGFSFTVRAHQLGLENALKMQRRERRREAEVA
jgi:hypothetical protein